MRVRIVGSFTDRISPALERIRRNILRTQAAMSQLSRTTVNTGGGMRSGSIGGGASGPLLAGGGAALGAVAGGLVGVRGAAQRTIMAMKAFNIASGAALGAAAVGATNVARRYENLSIQLEVAVRRLGQTSAETTKEAKEAFNFLQQLSTTLPLNVDELTNAFIKMKNLGLAPTKESLVSFTNTAAANGKTLMQFVEAVADASVGEFERLKEFGIKARTEADKVSFTFRGTTKEVGKNASDIVEYLQKIGETDFAGAATKQMDTLDGKLSNLGVAFDTFLNKIAEDTSILDWTKSAVDWLTSILDSFTGISYAINMAIAQIGEFSQRGWIKLKFNTLIIFEELKNQISIIFDSIINSQIDTINDFIDLVNEAIIKLNKVPKVNIPMVPGIGYIDTNTDNAAEAEKLRLEKELHLLYASQEWQNYKDFLEESHGIIVNKNQVTKDYNETLKEQKRLQNETLKEQKRLQEELRAKEEEKQRLANIKQKQEEESWLRLQEYRNGMKEIGGEIEGVFSTFFQELDNGFKSATENMFVNFKNMIDRMVAEALAAKVVRLLFGDITGSGNAGGLFGGQLQAGMARMFGRENGGPVQAGLPYIVGEKRPELFVPNQNGTIVPDLSMVGGSTVTINAIDSRSVAQFIDDNKFAFTQAVNNTNRRYNIG